MKCTISTILPYSYCYQSFDVKWSFRNNISFGNKPYNYVKKKMQDVRLIQLIKNPFVHFMKHRRYVKWKHYLLILNIMWLIIYFYWTSFTITPLIKHLSAIFLKKKRSKGLTIKKVHSFLLYHYSSFYNSSICAKD